MNIIRGFQYPDGTHTPLSNFFPRQIVYEGLEYPTNEHAFQAAKTHDDFVRRQIASADTPGTAKKIGRAIVLRRDWEDVKLTVMRDIVRAKFRIPMLGQWLLDTGDLYLEETNHWGDRYWGRGPRGRRTELARIRFDGCTCRAEEWSCARTVTRQEISPQASVFD